MTRQSFQPRRGPQSRKTTLTVRSVPYGKSTNTVSVPSRSGYRVRVKVGDKHSGDDCRVTDSVQFITSGLTSLLLHVDRCHPPVSFQWSVSYTYTLLSG